MNFTETNHKKKNSGDDWAPLFVNLERLLN
jgi:hypothetical protein